MLSRHQTLARGFPFLCSTLGTTASCLTVNTGRRVRQIRGRNFNRAPKPLSHQKLTSNAAPNLNSSLLSNSGNQCLLSGPTLSALGFTERSNRRRFSTSASSLAQAGHEELSENTDSAAFEGGVGGQARGDTGSRISRHNTEVTDNNGRVLKVNTKTKPLERFLKMIRAEIAKFLGSETKGKTEVEIKGETKDEKVSPISVETVVEKALNDLPREILDESPFVLQSNYADDMIEKLKQPETPENNSLEQEQFVEQSSYSFLGLDLEEQRSSPNATPNMGIPNSSSCVDKGASKVANSETSGFSSQEIFGSGKSASHRVSKKKQVGIDTHSTTVKATAPTKRGRKVTVARTRARKTVGIESTETVAKVETTPEKVTVARTRERKAVVGIDEAETAAEVETTLEKVTVARTRERKTVGIESAETVAEVEVTPEKVTVTRTREHKAVVGTESAETVAEVEATPKPKAGKSLVEFAKPLPWTELPYTPLTYHISEQTLLKKFSLRENSPLRYWRYDLYTSSTGEKVNIHYCRTIEAFDQVAKLFLNDNILGFDLEWVPSNFSTSKSAKVNASLMQIANQSDIALFHFARVPGQIPDFELIPPNLRRVLESENIMKTGVSVTGDAKRVSKFLGVHPAGIFELSDLWNLVHDVRTLAGSITRRLIALSRLTEECLYLPLDKSASRISNWAVELSNRQINYAANDAYAAFRVFDALEGKRRSSSPIPRFPGCRIIPPQEPPSDSDYPIIEEEVEEYDYEPKRIHLDGPEVDMASSWATLFLEALAKSGKEAKAQHSQLKAYSLWHDGKHSVEKIAELCRNPPLKETTVVMHILEAIQLENLPYDDGRLAELRRRIPKPFINGKYQWVFSAPNKDVGNGGVYLS